VQGFYFGGKRRPGVSFAIFPAEKPFYTRKNESALRYVIFPAEK